jgi:hypothetical protein
MLSLGLRGRELGAPPRGRLEPANALAMYADSLEPRSERETRVRGCAAPRRVARVSVREALLTRAPAQSSVFNLRFSPRGSE